MFAEVGFSKVSKYPYAIISEVILEGIDSAFIEICRADTQNNMPCPRRGYQFGNPFKAYGLNIENI